MPRGRDFPAASPDSLPPLSINSTVVTGAMTFTTPVNAVAIAVDIITGTATINGIAALPAGYHAEWVSPRNQAFANTIDITTALAGDRVVVHWTAL